MTVAASTQLAEGSPSHPPLQVSKWLHSDVLLDPMELKLLLEEVGPCSLHPLGVPVASDGLEVAPQEFQDRYRSYVSWLRSGQGQGSLWSRQFALVVTTSLDSLFAVSLGDERRVVRASRPVVQLQHHHFHCKEGEGKARSLLLGEDAISWGLRFSFPQLWLDAESGKVVALRREDTSGNSVLFLAIQRWLRRHTVPLVLMDGDMKVVTSIRTGRRCVEWIEAHHQLSKRGLIVIWPGGMA